MRARLPRGPGRRRLPSFSWVRRLALAAAHLAAAGAGVAQADVVIAVAGPADGPRATVAAHIADAVAFAAREINARGGVAGQTLALRRIDDGCGSTTAAIAARTLVAERPALVIGHPCSGGAIAAARVYGPAHLLFIATETRHAGLTARRPGPTVFRLSGRDDDQGTLAGRHLARAYSGRRVAVVSDRTAYARAIVEKARAALIAGGAEPAMATIVAGEKDYGALVARVRDWHCSAVLFAGFPVEAASVLRQLRAAGLAVAFMATDAVATPEFASAAGAAGDGARVLMPADPAHWPAASGLVARLSAAGLAADAAAVRATAAVELWASAVAAAGSLEPDAVAAILSKGEHATALGPVAFDAMGDASLAAYDVLVWRQSQWVREDD